MAADMMYTAISGLNTFSDALSVVSDNIANANTTGWKSNTVDFGDLVSGIMATDSNNVTAQGVGSTIIGVTSDFSTGNEIQTGNWSDVMIQGNGFFAVQNSAGATEYTRDGSFQLEPIAADTQNLYLVDAQGNPVLDSAGAVIKVDSVTNPTYSSYSINSTGQIIGTAADGTTTVIDTIGITTFPNDNGLTRQGLNMYSPGASAGTGVLGTAGTGQAGTLVPGALEGSNVDLTQQMVDLIDYQADYQANSKSITTGDNLLQTVVNLIR